MASITTNVGALNVQSIVSQLMTIEQQPMTASQARSSKYNTQLSAMGKISSALSNLQTIAGKLATGSFLQQFKVASTDTTVATANTSSGSGTAGSYTLNVTQLAQAHQLVFDQAGGAVITDPKAALTDVPSSISLNVGGTITKIDLSQADGSSVSLQTIADRINQSSAAVTASVVQNKGQYKLVLASSSAGEDNAFSIVDGVTDSGETSGASLAGLTQSTTAVSESANASDASLTVNGVNVTSGSNHVSGVIAGVTVDLTKVGTSTITMSSDSSAISTSLQGFVDAYNQVRSAVESARAGSMQGNASLLTIEQKMQEVLSTPVAGADPGNSYAYLSQVGIAVQKDGSLKLDQTAFNKALDAQPTAVAALFGNTSNTGFADRFNSAINAILAPNGVVESSKATINSRMSAETHTQTMLASRLKDKQAQYVKQYTALNSLLAKMQSATTNMAALLASSS